MTPTAARLDAATAELLTGSLRELLTGLSPGGATLRGELDALGWADVLADDPAAATTLLFSEHGRALASSRALDDVLLAELAPVLPAASGHRALLYPLDRTGARPAATGEPLTGLLLAPLDDDTTEVVVATTTDGTTTDGTAGVTLHVLPAGQIAAGARPVHGFDPRAGWLRAELGPVRDAGSAAPADEAWARAVAAGRRALAAEILGTCQAALALAVAHTSSRVQYGRAIATFQAVRHRLAESHVAIEAARSSLDAAWDAHETAGGGAWAATLAKLRAGQAQAEVMRHASQVCGAMGLSQESELHRFVTRSAALDVLLGGHRALTEQVGAALLAGAELDPLVGI